MGDQDVSGYQEVGTYTFGDAPPRIVEVVSSASVIDRKKDDPTSAAVTSSTITVTVRDSDYVCDGSVPVGEWGPTFRDGLSVAVRDALGNSHPLVLHDFTVLGGDQTGQWTFTFDPPDSLSDGALGEFSVEVDVTDGLKTAASAPRLFRVDDINLSASLSDLEPRYGSSLTVSGTAARVAGGAVDNVWAEDSQLGDFWIFSPGREYERTYEVTGKKGSRSWVEVRARAANGALDAPVQYLSYRVAGSPPDPPTGLLADGQPSPATTDARPRFEWSFSDPDPGDEPFAFRLQVASEKSAEAVMWDTGKRAWATSIEYPEPLFVGCYYWRVKSWDGDDLEGAWSDWQRFDINLPPRVENLSPSNVTTDSAPVLSWEYFDPDGASQANYQVQVGTASGLGDVWDSGVRAGSSSSIALAPELALVPGQTYHWRVRVSDGLEWSDWSGAAFAVNQLYAVRVDPETLTFSWDYSDPEGDNQTGYRIQTGSAPGSSDLWDSGAVLGSTTSVRYAGEQLERGATYYYRQQIKIGREWTDWVEGSFRLNELPLARRMEVVNAVDGYVGDENLQLFLTASDPDGTVTHMAFSLDNENWSWQPWTTQTTYLIDSVEGIPQTIYFKVRDDSGESSNVLSVTVILDLTPPKGLELVSPAENATVGAATVFLDWSRAKDNLSGVADYLIEWDNDPDLSAPAVENSTAFTYWEVPFENYQGDYYWRVRVRDRVGNEHTSPIYRYTYDPDAPPVTVIPAPDEVSVPEIDIEVGGGAAGISIGGGEWIDFTPSLNLTLTGVEGFQSSPIEFRNEAGIVAGPFGVGTVVDLTPPLLQVFPTLQWTRENRATLEIVGLDEVTDVAAAKVWLGDEEPEEWENFVPGKIWYPALPEGEGDYVIHIKLRDLAGNETEIANAIVKVRRGIRFLTMPSTSVEGDYLILAGRVEPGVEVWVNGTGVDVGSDGSFSARVELSSGTNEVKVRARDPAGNEWSDTFTIEGPSVASTNPFFALGIVTTIGSGAFFAWLGRKYQQTRRAIREALRRPSPRPRTKAEAEAERSYRRWLERKRRKLSPEERGEKPP